VVKLGKKEKKMEEKIWSKTLLTCYDSLEKIANAIDNLVVTNCVNSASNGHSILQNANRVIDLMERKKKIVNIKVLIEDVLSFIEPKHTRVLILKYVDRVKSEDMAKVLNVSLRTLFRKINRSLELFAEALIKKGYSPEVLSLWLENEGWIKELYNALIKKELGQEIKENAEKNLDVNYLSLAFKSIKAVPYRAF